jgi:hypothetical protein
LARGKGASPVTSSMVTVCQPLCLALACLALLTGCFCCLVVLSGPLVVSGLLLAGPERGLPSNVFYGHYLPATLFGSCLFGITHGLFLLFGSLVRGTGCARALVGWAEMGRSFKRLLWSLSARDFARLLMFGFTHGLSLSLCSSVWAPACVRALVWLGGRGPCEKRLLLPLAVKDLVSLLLVWH